MINQQNKANEAVEAIRRTYLTLPQPWVVGFSGGQDSTCVLQLVFTNSLAWRHRFASRQLHFMHVVLALVSRLVHLH